MQCLMAFLMKIKVISTVTMKSMPSNLGDEDGDNPTEQEEHFVRAELMAGSLGVAGRDHDNEEARLPLVASVMGPSNANPDVSAIEDDLSDGEVLAAYTVWIRAI